MNETRLDKTVVAIIAATLVVLYLFLWHVLEGSWAGMLTRVIDVVVPVAVYLALIAGVALLRTRRGGGIAHSWFLLLLPLFGAAAGVVAELLDIGPGDIVQSAVTGACYGAMHALLLRWSWRRAAQRSSAPAA